MNCAQGRSRSATFAIAYLMARGATYEEAYAEVKQARPFIHPNEGFQKQLRHWQPKLQGSEAS